MAYSDILVHVPALTGWSAGVDAAVDLAARHGALLTALHTDRAVATLKVAFGRHHDIVVERQALAERQAAEHEAKFRLATAARNVPCVWQVAEGDAGDLVTLAARLHDLVVCERSSPDTDEGGWDVAESSAMGSGRPTLVVPPGWTGPIGTRVLMAWNDSREAALAFHGAKPFLTDAEHITAVAGQGKEAVHRFVTKLPKSDLDGALKRLARPYVIEPFAPTDADAGVAILAKAASIGANLVVMGAYGRSRVSEMILGGATRHVLREAKVPLLLAH